MKEETRVFTYFVDLPPGVNEFVTPCGDGNYTVYIDAKLSDYGRMEAYRHAVDHIREDDHDSKESVDEIEMRAHGG